MRRGDYIEFVSTPILDGASPVDFTGLGLRASIRQGPLNVAATSVSGTALGVVTATFASAITRQFKAGAATFQVQLIDVDKENIIINTAISIGPSNFLR